LFETVFTVYISDVASIMWQRDRHWRSVLSLLVARRSPFLTTTASSWRDSRPKSRRKPNVSRDSGTTFCATPTAANHISGLLEAQFVCGSTVQCVAITHCKNVLPKCSVLLTLRPATELGDKHRQQERGVNYYPSILTLL